MLHQPIVREPRRLDRTRAECAALVAAGPAQPNNALYRRTPEQLTDAVFAIAGAYRTPAEICAELTAATDLFVAQEEAHRAERAARNAEMDVRRDAGLARLGYK